MQRKFIFYSNIDFQRIYFPITIPSIPLYLNMLLVLASFWKWKFEISRFLRFLQPRNMLDMSVTKQVLKPLTSSFLSSEQPQNIVFIFVTFLVSKLPVSSFSSFAQIANISPMLVTLLVLNLLTSTFSIFYSWKTSRTYL